MGFSSSTAAGVGDLPDRWSTRVLHAADEYRDSDMLDSLQHALLTCQRASLDHDLLATEGYLAPAQMLSAVHAAAESFSPATVHLPADLLGECESASRGDAEQQHRITRRLAEAAHLGCEFHDKLLGLTRFVEYHIDFLEPPAIPQESGEIGLLLTVLRRDDKPVILSFAQQQQVEGKVVRQEKTLLLDDDDEFGERVFDRIREKFAD